MKIRILSIDIDKSEGSDTIIDKSKGVKNYTPTSLNPMLWPRLRLGLRMSMLATSSFWVGFPHYIRSKQGEWAYDAISFKGSDATRLVSHAHELNSLNTFTNLFCRCPAWKDFQNSFNGYALGTGCGILPWRTPHKGCSAFKARFCPIMPIIRKSWEI